MFHSLSRRLAGATAIAVAVGTSVALVLAPASPAGAATVDPDVVYVEDFEGWGTALSWGANVVGGWSDPKRIAIADLLFASSGLGLNVVRYEIGGGLNPNWQTIGCGQHRPGSPLPAYSTSPGVYDWTADANQRWFAQTAQARGVDTWLASAFSPPYWMTNSGCSNGSVSGNQNLGWAYNGGGFGAYNDTTSYSKTTDDSVTVAFNGTQIAFYAAKSSDSGRAAISVDGGAETIVDLYAAVRQGDQLVYTSPLLSSGSHTLTVRVAGTKNASSTNFNVSPDRVVLTPGGISIDDQVRGTGVNQFNYHGAMYGLFADYLTEVTKHFRDSWNITFDLLGPINEPAHHWSKAGKLEGAYYDPHSQDKLVTLVGQSLATKGLTGTRVAAPDDDSVANAVSTFNSYSSTAKSYISTVTTHTYGTSTADAQNLRNAAAAAGKELWVSEYGTGGATTDPGNVQPALNLATRIVGDLTDLRPTAWIVWDGIESVEENAIASNPGWGLIWAEYLNDDETFTVAKQYYGYGNFTKFIRPGYRIIASGDPGTVAAFDPVSGRVVLVAYNNGGSARSVTYDLSGFDDVITAVTPYRTSGTENLARLTDIAVSGNQLSVTLPAKSITTFVTPTTTVDDRDTGTGRQQFEYVGSWNNNPAEPNAYLGGNGWSSATNAYYQVRFHGTAIDLYGAKAPNHGIAAVSIDGGPETLVDFYAPSRIDNVVAYSSPGLSAGNHTLKVRVTGTKNGLSSGFSIPADRVDITQPNATRLNDNTTGPGTNQFDYHGSWSYYGAQTGAWANDNHYSAVTNAFYEVTFTGSKIDLYGAKAANHGIAAVSIDGGAETLVDLYRATRVDNILIWSSPGLSAGNHTLKVRVTGTKNGLSSGVSIPADRVDVFP
jgi:O-glycosyl hydrolase/riboflavin biosynthesis pyrimidine reductase